MEKFKPYLSTLGNSWLEENVTIPLWTKVFKKLGIYDEDYHEKYRQHILNKRYEKYIDLVIEDIKNKWETKIIYK